MRLIVFEAVYKRCLIRSIDMKLELENLSEDNGNVRYKVLFGLVLRVDLILNWFLF